VLVIISAELKLNAISFEFHNILRETVRLGDKQSGSYAKRFLASSQRRLLSFSDGCRE
jgi:hypothetical protein